jgi:hypothetical protein
VGEPGDGRQRRRRRSGWVGGHAGGGFTRVDVLGDGEIVTTFVPPTGRDTILYDVIVD